MRRAATRPRSKYGNRITVVDGETFHSKAEALQWVALRLLEKGGLIRELRRQVPFTLVDKAVGQRATVYVVDFTFVEGGRLIALEVKGVMTRVAALKIKLFKVKFPDIELRVVRV